MSWDGRTREDNEVDVQIMKPIFPHFVWNTRCSSFPGARYSLLSSVITLFLPFSMGMGTGGYGYGFESDVDGWVVGGGWR